jgi:hypothetical protein
MRRTWLQALAFLLIVLPSLALYAAVNAGSQWLTVLLFALVLGGMVLGMCIR